MTDDNIFGGREFDDFSAFDDLNDDLDSEPDFSGFGETDLGLATDDDEILAMEFEEEEPGISRTFQLLIGAGIVLVFIIVIALILFAVLSGDDLTAGEQTATAAILTNTAIASEYAATLEAIQIAQIATETAVAHGEETATAVRIGQITQEAQMTADAEASLTAEAEAEATLFAQAATSEAGATAEAIATKDAGRLYGQLLAEGGVPISNATVQLYRDDGDNTFSSTDAPLPTSMPVPTSPPVDTGADTGSDTGSDAGNDTGSDTGSDTGLPQTISYGQLVMGTLATGQVDTWTFTGSTGDMLIINAISSSPSMDLFLRLYGPEGLMEIEDDNGSGGTDPAISNFELATNGQYTIEVSSITGSGNYTLSLSLGLSIPDTGVDDVAVPTQEETGYNSNGKKEEVMIFARVQGPVVINPALRQDPNPLTQDQLVDIITTGTNGEFDFGSLPPGTYWLVIDYNSLSPDLQNLIPPTSQLVFQVVVPVGGEFNITVVELTPTPTTVGDVNPFDQTATAMRTRTLGVGEIVTETPSPEITGTLMGTLPNTGIFDEIGGGNSDLDGTGGLTVLAIAAAGLVAVVFIARKLRSAT